MSGPRDPTPFEADMYKDAIANKGGAQLRTLVRDMYPNVMWGRITRELSEEDRKWVMENLQPEPEPEFSDDGWGWVRPA